MIINPHKCLYSRANELLCDVNVLNRDMQSNLSSIYWLDAYGSQLWHFFNKARDIYFMLGVRLLGNTSDYHTIHTVD